MTIVAHHFSGRSLAIELGIVVALLALFVLLVLRERHRRARRTKPQARMRDV
jgi:hypothetical protein